MHGTMMWKREVQVSAYREGEESWRLVRLGRLVGWLEAHDPEGFREHIISLGDRKGNLSVDWDAEPGEAARKLVGDGWADEYECVVDHYWPGGGLQVVR